MNQRPELSERLSTCPLVRLGQNSGKQAIDNNSKIPSSYISENFNYHPLYIDTYEENSEQKYENKQLPVEKSQNFNYVQNYYLPDSYNNERLNDNSPYSNKDSIELSCFPLNEHYWDHDKHSKINNIESANQNVFTKIQDTNCLLDNFTRLGKSSPSLDQGYHTLVTPNQGLITPTFWNTNLYKGKKYQPKNNSFDKLPDELVVKVFSFLTSVDLSICAQVCRRFDILAWTPSLWRVITIEDDNISGDKAIRCVLRQLCGQGKTGACPNVERIHITNGAKLSEKSLILLARRCPELTHLQLQGCTNLTNSVIFEIATRCTSLQHLDITGCTKISCISINNGLQSTRRLQLQYLDLSDCVALQDSGLLVIVRNSPLLAYLYLRRCVQITDAGLKYVPSFCSGLRELSVSDCSNITDFGLYELAKLGATLRYLSVAKCDQVSDAGLKVIAKKCYKLRYLNARGCEAVSDDAINILARSCTRLRALDIGKCDVSDAGLRSLAESCPNLKKLSLRNCDLVTDRGVQCIAYYCRGLQQLNIQDCQISIDGYRAVKKYCKRCVIEHTNPGFF
ncbi:unnamed protein product [Psylliodes chrysocephalus]|uniref:F-box domain-containing protein n=1 Tax=Psylliodes chrysocephalus TaxID=3402493 RepID=A0A9P0CJH9_9CUCU|nr:unnamed protein product [Psylliodes chrysocephala]